MSEVLDESRAEALTPGALPTERGPGIYAAWITSQGCQAAGIDGPTRCAYVGKASDLRARLKRHVDGYFLDLSEILACRGLVLFNWCDRYRPPLKGKMVQQTPLSRISITETQAWQRDNLVWSWMSCTRERLLEVERDAIRERAPLLNRTHAGAVAPQLRYQISSPQARIRWLWHASWAGLVLRPFPLRARSAQKAWGTEPPGMERRIITRGHNSFPVDHHGYPEPLTAVVSGTSVKADVRIPSRKTLRAAFSAASRHADPQVKDAVSHAEHDELCAWWAAHCGAPYLADGATIENAIATSLERKPETIAPSPTVLPAKPQLTALLQLIRSLNTVTD
jgi:hypothetical protein